MAVQERPAATVEPLLDDEGVAEILRVSPRTVRRLIEGGELRAVQVGRRRRLVEPDEVRNYIASRRRPLEAE